MVVDIVCDECKRYARVNFAGLRVSLFACASLLMLGNVVRIRIKCCWDQAVSFKPRCSRCNQYDLPCKIDGATWSARAQRHFMSTIPRSSSRSIFWGPTSTAAGHPLEVHGPDGQPQPPVKAHIPRPPSPTNRHSTCISGRIHLDVDSRVKAHLYSIFFTHIHPVWPVVRQPDVMKRTPAPILDCAILGTAARHHLAITSWRDWVHIQRVLACELRWVFNIRKPYRPDLETLQALLILCLRLELSTQSHVDVMSLPVRLGLLCQMARDLRIDQYNQTPELDPDDRLLRRNIWLACLFQDAYLSAMFGQPLSIGVRDCHELLDEVESAKLDPACPRFFLDAIAQSLCLRQILRTAFTADQLTSSSFSGYRMLSDFVTQCHDRLECDRMLLDDDDQYRALRIMAHNNRLLHIFGLIRSMQQQALHDTPNNDIQANLVLQREANQVVMEACETLEWMTPEFRQSSAGQIEVGLYCAVRALMVVVDVYLHANSQYYQQLQQQQQQHQHHHHHHHQQSYHQQPQQQRYSQAFVNRLEGAISSARILRDHLLQDSSWGFHWIQGHTITAVLRRLDQTQTQLQDEDNNNNSNNSNSAKSFTLTPDVLSIVSLCNPSEPALITPPPDYPSGSDVFDDDALGCLDNEAFLCSTDWSDVFRKYDLEYGWTIWPSVPG